MSAYNDEIDEELSRAPRPAQLDMFENVMQFHRAADMHNSIGLWNDPEILELRRNLCEEEIRETAEGFGYLAPDWGRACQVDHVKIADGLCDSIFVNIGALLHLYGEACARALWTEVCRANATKFPGGKVIRRADGKILKPEGWTPPDIEGVLRKHGVLS